MLAVKAEGLTRKFDGFTAVNALSFEVDEGEIFGLLGPNGAGKTTTVRMLSCIISPTSGMATVAGHDIRSNPTGVRRSVGILTENPSLYERLTALENLEFFAQAYGIKESRQRAERIRELLEFFRLWDRKDDKVTVFSKGMKQKLAIARALVHNPTVLFLDEPTAGLDPEAAKLIRDMVTEMSGKERRTILICTHRLEDAERVCTKVMIIKRGAGVVIGSPDELRLRMAGRPRIEVRVKGDGESFADLVRRIPSVIGVDVINGRIVVTSKNPEEAAPEVVRALVNGGAMVLSVNETLPSLEEAYLRLIKEDA
mgnify:CR=1 FL=1|uniref:ABC transporter ATP-binding protein n=1 Tax=Candidatus Methanomethylicus mesodigestus TaxID=1867258 RepID=A0A7C3EX50_9CREN